MTSSHDARVRQHADEIFIDAAQVRRLLDAQFPHWAGLPIAPVRSNGTDNAIYRLGADMAVRMPRRPGAISQVDREARWLPFLAPHLPLAIPVPLATGMPGEDYPWRWAVCPWVEGENPDPERLVDPHAFASDLARFILALRAIDARGAPRPGAENFGRGGPLALRDEAVRHALAKVGDMLDAGAAASLWDADKHAAPWDGPPLWIHGDLNVGNLLVVNGRLSGVIDFGCLAAGDPACELLAAWFLFDADARATFRRVLDPDDDSWARGSGWALSMTLIGLAYYRETNPVLVANALRAVEAILRDARQ